MKYLIISSSLSFNYGISKEDYISVNYCVEITDSNPCRYGLEIANLNKTFFISNIDIKFKIGEIFDTLENNPVETIISDSTYSIYKEFKKLLQTEVINKLI